MCQGKQSVLCFGIGGKKTKEKKNPPPILFSQKVNELAELQLITAQPASPIATLSTGIFSQPQKFERVDSPNMHPAEFIPETMRVCPFPFRSAADKDHVSVRWHIGG